jgi:hypothetical protein
VDNRGTTSILGCCCAAILRLRVVGSFGQFVIGWTVILRTLINRHISGDKTTLQIWNLWMVSLYMLPLISAYAML